MTALCLWLAGALAGRGQDLRYLHAQTWLTGDGLPQDSVHQVLQTRDGFIWVATEGGLARFDGVQFRTFTHETNREMLSDDICCLAQGSDGALWVGTGDGLLRLRPSGLDQFSLERFGREQGLGSSAVRGLLAEPDGTLMVLTAEGLTEWRQGRFTEISGAPANIQSIAPARDGIWVLAGGKALLWRGGRRTATEASGVAGGAVAGLAEGLQDRLWIFSNSTVEALGAGLPRRWGVGAELPGSRVVSLFVDREGRAWVGTNAGVTVLDAGGSVGQVPALRGSTILQTYEDREGNLWFGGETTGLHILRQLKFRGESGLAGEGVTAVAQAGQDTVWIGTRRDGLRRVRSGAVDEPAPTVALTSPVILSLARGLDGGVWAGTPDGLNRIRGDGAVQRFTSVEGLPDDFIQALADAGNGGVWIGTRRGLARLDGTHVDVVTHADGLANDLVASLLQGREGSLWIGTANGLTRRSADGTMTSYAAKDGVGAGVISALAQDESGALWVGGQNGTLSKFMNGAFYAMHPAGMSSARGPVLGLAVSAGGWLWLRQEHGIGRVRIAELNQCVEKPAACSAELTSYGAGDGILSVESMAEGSPALYRMANGELWFATRRGVAIANADDLPLNTVPPPVSIERVLAGDAAVTLANGQVELPFSTGRLTIEYAGLSFTAPGEVRYRFMLEGFDHGWTEAGNRRAATYTNLSPGSYSFHVQAMNNDGVWSASAAELRLRIVPPYYRRWWFVVLVLAGLGLIAAALYRLRLRRLQAAFAALLQERNRIAREIHDTLAQDFVGVTIQLDLVAQLLKMQKIDAALQQVGQARTLVTDGLAEARRSIWQLRANVSEASLPARLRLVTGRYADDSLKVKLAVGGAYRELPSRVEDEVLRIAQEALSNVQRHAGAAHATVGLEYGSDMLLLAVEDDGRGFEPAAVAEGHYGLQGIRERAQELGATLEIASRPQQGTSIRLAVAIAGV